MKLKIIEKSNLYIQFVQNGNIKSSSSTKFLSSMHIKYWLETGTNVEMKNTPYLIIQYNITKKIINILYNFWKVGFNKFKC